MRPAARKAALVVVPSPACGGGLLGISTQKNGRGQRRPPPSVFSMQRLLRLIACAVLSTALASFAHAQTVPPAAAPILTNTARMLPALAPHGMVASQEKRA